MIVVDTSVWVDFFRGTATAKTDRLVLLIEQDAALAITDIVLTEILQGLRREGDVRRVERRLAHIDILRLETLDDFRRAAAIYRAARRKGVTVRRTLDCLIAAVCIRNDAALLHDDRDFDHIASVSKLQIAS